MYEIVGEWTANRAIAPIPCSIPLPGLNKPHVKTDGRGMSGSSGPEKLGVAPCGIMTTASGFASYTATMRWSSDWLCTTATAAASRIRSSTSRWCTLGSSRRGVKHGHERDLETVDEVEHLLAVVAAEQPVLMLKQHRVEVVQRRQRTAQ